MTISCQGWIYLLGTINFTPILIRGGDVVGCLVDQVHEESRQISDKNDAANAPTETQSVDKAPVIVYCFPLRNRPVNVVLT